MFRHLFCYAVFMNALFTSKIANYIQTPEALATAKQIIFIKVHAQIKLLQRYKVDKNFLYRDMSKNVPELLLVEARYAKQFWQEYKKLLPEWTQYIFLRSITVLFLHHSRYRIGMKTDANDDVLTFGKVYSTIHVSSTLSI